MVKLKCTNSIEPTDKKPPFFSKGKVYDASVIDGIRDELSVEGDRERKAGGKSWQAVKCWPDYWAVLGVATFSEVKE